MQIFTTNYSTKAMRSLTGLLRNAKNFISLCKPARHLGVSRESRLYVSGKSTVALMALCVFMGFTSSVFAQADFVASPSSVSINQNDTFTVTIALQTGNSQTVDGAEIHFDFDPAILQVRAVTALSNPQLPTEILGAPKFDNTA